MSGLKYDRKVPHVMTGEIHGQDGTCLVCLSDGARVAMLWAISHGASLGVTLDAASLRALAAALLETASLLDIRGNEPAENGAEPGPDQGDSFPYTVF